MESFSVQLLVFGLFAAFANVFGGLMLFPSRAGKGYKRSLKYLLALGAGFMLAVTFFEIVPKTILLWQQTHGGVSDELYVPMVLLLAGYLLTQFFEHTIAPHFHLGEEIDSHEVIPKASVYSGLAGFLVTRFSTASRSRPPRRLISRSDSSFSLPFCSTSFLRVLRSAQWCWPEERGFAR